MKLASKLLFVALLGLYTLPLEASSPRWSGYAKNFTVAYRYPEFAFLGPSGDTLVGSNQRLRLNFSWSPSSLWSIHLAYDLAPQIQSEGLNMFPGESLAATRRAYRAADFDPLLFPDDRRDASHLLVTHNLDRANLNFSFDTFDLIIGRQAIAWGAARIVNPTDILTPFTYNELDVEDRVGVDAVRVRIPVGSLSELDFGYVFGRDLEFDSSAFFLRGKFYQSGTDYSLLAMGFQENLLLGGDVTRSLAGAGIWLEAGHVLVGALGNRRLPGEDYLRLSAGADYSLRDATYLFFEYHYSQAGKSASEDYFSLLREVAVQEGAVYLLGRHYFAGGLSRPLTPLLQAGFEILASGTDGSFFIVPNFEYNLAQNFYLSGGAYLGFGSSPPNGSSPLDPGSEFASYPDLLFASLRYYY